MLDHLKTFMKATILFIYVNLQPTYLRFIGHQQNDVGKWGPKTLDVPHNLKFTSPMTHTPMRNMWKKKRMFTLGLLYVLHLYSISTRVWNGSLHDHFPMANWWWNLQYTSTRSGGSWDFAMSLGPTNLGLVTPSKTPSAYVVRTHGGNLILSSIGPWSMNTFHYKLSWNELWMKTMHIHSSICHCAL